MINEGVAVCQIELKSKKGGDKPAGNPKGVRNLMGLSATKVSLRWLMMLPTTE
jgi:hypothetical protein